MYLVVHNYQHNLPRYSLIPGAYEQRTYPADLLSSFPQGDVVCWSSMRSCKYAAHEQYCAMNSCMTGCYTAKYPRVCNRMWASTSCYRPVYVALQTWKSTCCVQVVYTELCSTDTIQVWYRFVIRVGNRCVIIRTVYKLYLHVCTVM